MSCSIWMGTEEAHASLAMYEKKFAGEIQAFHRGDDEDDEPTLDKNFNVLNNRIGLSLIERFADKAVIKVHGSLTNSYVWWHSCFPGEVTSYEAIKDALAIVGNEQGISQVYMHFVTGGGVVRGLDTVSEMIRRVDAVKPVHAHTDSHAFSAGYWLAAATRRITATRMAEVGSIGTLIVLENYAEAAEKSGVKYHVFRAGKFKALGMPMEALSEEAAAYIQANLEKTNDFFLQHVSRHRNLMVSDRAQWAEGKTFFAEEALQVGLIDQVATLDDLIGSAASTTLTSDTRRFEMIISPEKLAQIEAGADPKVVLTEAELIQYEAALATEPEPAAVVEEEEDPVAAAVPELTAFAGTDLVAALKDNGKLEAKLEASQVLLATATAEATASQLQMAGLLTVAQAAVGKLQAALQLPKEAKVTASEVITQYTELQTQMASRFKVGQSTTTPTADIDMPSATASFRHN